MTKLTGPEDLRAAEDALFARWKMTYGSEPFLPDGAMPDFAAQAFRVVFVLKEGNDEEGIFAEGGGDLRSASEWDRQWTWPGIGRWAGLILEGLDVAAVRSLSSARIRALLRKIAFINLKKKPGASTAVAREIWRYARQDAAFIRDQIALYEPHLVLCCGVPTFGPLQKEVYEVPDCDRLSVNDEGEKFFFHLPNGALVVDFWHPLYKSEEYDHDLAAILAYLRGLGYPLPPKAP